MYIICKVHWKDGCIKSWDSENNQWVRDKSEKEYHLVRLKYLLNSLKRRKTIFFYSNY